MRKRRFPTTTTNLDELDPLGLISSLLLLELLQVLLLLNLNLLHLLLEFLNLLDELKENSLLAQRAQLIRIQSVSLSLELLVLLDFRKTLLAGLHLL